MKRKSYRNFLALMIIGWVLLLGTPAAYAIPDWSFNLLPAGGNISGTAGSTIGWGYTISNPDPENWLSLTAVNADSFLYGTPDSSIFDFPVVAPAGTVSVSYDGVNGLYQLTWDPNAPMGFVNSGTFVLSGEWYDGAGNFLDFALDQSADYSATVTSAGTTPVPEPATYLLLAFGFAGFGLLGWMRPRLLKM